MLYGYQVFSGDVRDPPFHSSGVVAVVRSAAYPAVYGEADFSGQVEPVILYQRNVAAGVAGQGTVPVVQVFVCRITLPGYYPQGGGGCGHGVPYFGESVARIA